MKNIHPIDRIVRLVLAALLLEAAYFWLTGSGQIAAYALGVVMLVTSGMGFCPLYRILGISGGNAQPVGGVAKVIGAVLVLATVVGGSYASSMFSRKFFLEDFNAMNGFYKQTLFLTGKAEREKALANYEKLVPAYKAFQEKYTAYQPVALRADPHFMSDLVNVEKLITQVNDKVRTGDLQQAHLDLEKVRPYFQEIFKRNGFSMLSVALVDFHDAMELVLDAGKSQDSAKVIALYPQVSEKLQAVQSEVNDEEIQAIRANLDRVLATAQAAQKEALPEQVEQLKSSFVKVYLKRG